MKKKILFIITNTNIFTGFFKSEIKNISKSYDIYFLVSSYGFDNIKFHKSKLRWFRELKRKKLVKKIILLKTASYTNFIKTLIFNKQLISKLKEIKNLNIDYFLFPNRSMYWEEIFFEYFKKKKIFCYLTNPPSSLDFFNNIEAFKKSFFKKKVYRNHIVKSDNPELHFQNTKSLNRENYFDFFVQKINIFLSKQINHFFLPIFLIRKKININSIYYKLDLNFLNFKKIIIFSEEFKIFFKKISITKDTKIYLCSKNSKNINIKNYNWIFPYASNDTNTLSKLFKYLLMLKKLKKINQIYFKGHPTWKHENIDKNFFKKLRNNNIKYKQLDSYQNINFSKYYGVISIPSTVLIESTYHNPDIKIIGIKRNKNLTSGLLYKFYSINKKKIIWEPNLKDLKIYIKIKNKNKLIVNNLKNFFSQF